MDIVDGKLFFATGSILSFAGNEYEFGTESSVINIVGKIPSIGINTYTILMNGVMTGEAEGWSNPHFSIGRPAGDINRFNTLQIYFTDTKDSALLDYFGLPSGTYTEGLNLSFWRLLFQVKMSSSLSIRS